METIRGLLTAYETMKLKNSEQRVAELAYKAAVNEFSAELKGRYPEIDHVMYVSRINGRTYAIDVYPEHDEATNRYHRVSIIRAYLHP